jgi:hypothetical protein
VFNFMVRGRLLSCAYSMSTCINFSTKSGIFDDGTDLWRWWCWVGHDIWHAPHP